MGKLTKLFIGCTAIGIAAATAYYFMERNAESEIPAADKKQKKKITSLTRRQGPTRPSSASSRIPLKR